MLTKHIFIIGPDVFDIYDVSIAVSSRISTRFNPGSAISTNSTCWWQMFRRCWWRKFVIAILKWVWRLLWPISVTNIRHHYLSTTSVTNIEHQKSTKMWNKERIMNLCWMKWKCNFNFKGFKQLFKDFNSAYKSQTLILAIKWVEAFYNSSFVA